MTEHRIGTQEEWQAQRNKLLKEEKELTRRSDELASRRRELPWVPVEKDYRFETEDGTKTLADLFDGRSQLVVYHFMFGPDWEAGCPVCSSIADTLAPQVPHLKARDTTLLLASRAPLEKLLAYRERMGWGIGWVSSGGSDFNRDLGFLHTKEELKPFLEGEIPVTVEQQARVCATDVAGYVSEWAGAERVRAIGRDRLPDLRNDPPRTRGRDGLLPAARPDSQGARRGWFGAVLGAAPRRVRANPRPRSHRVTPPSGRARAPRSGRGILATAVVDVGEILSFDVTTGIRRAEKIALLRADCSDESGVPGAVDLAATR